MRLTSVCAAVAALVGACGTPAPTASNHPPEVAPREITTAEDTQVVIAVAAADPDSDAMELTSGAPGHGTVTRSGMTLTYTPAADYHGPDAIVVTVSDGTMSASATLSITVTPVDDRPVAGDDRLAAVADQPTSVAAAALLANDTDVDGDTLRLTAVAAPSTGTVTLTGGVVTFTPAAHFTGTATFEYTVADDSETDTGTVTVGVGGVNHAPIAIDDAVTATEDTALTLAAATLATNDTDEEGQALSVTAVGGATHGTVTLAGGTITYTPIGDFSGTATFDYTVSDGAATDTGTVTVSIAAQNDPPAAAAADFATDEDVPVEITLSGSDLDGTALTFAIVTGPAAGTLGPIARVTDSTARVIYMPDPDSTADDRFTFRVDDGSGGSATATVTIAVASVDDPPVASAGTATAGENTPVVVTLSGTDDADGPGLTFAIVTAPTAGTLGPITRTSATTATVTYTPDAGSSADDAFTFLVDDGAFRSQPAAIAIDVVPVDDAPVAQPGDASTREDTPVTITLTGSDLEGAALAFSIDAEATLYGTLGPIEQTSPTTAIVTYTPNPDSTTDDVIVFRVNDGAQSSAPAEVTIAVIPVDDGPVAWPAAVTTGEDTAIEITLAGSDAEGYGVLFALGSGPASGVLGPITQVSPTLATVTYTPAPDATGEVSFTFLVSDGSSDSAPATVTISVTPVNDGPVAVDDTDSVDRGGTLVRDGSIYTANDGDLDGPTPLTVTAVSNPVNGTVSVVANTVTFVPTPGFAGVASFDYQVSDGLGASDAGHVEVTVIETNTVPVAVDDVATTAEDTILSITAAAFAGNDVDPDPQTLSITAAQNPVNGTIVVVGGTPIFVPVANYSGPASFEYVVSDGIASDVGRVDVTVTAVNDTPLATDDTLTVAEDAAATLVDVLANDSDVEGALAVTAVTQGAHGLVTLVAGAVRYQPAANYGGADGFSYTVTDGDGATVTAAVAVTVTGVNDAPIALGQTISLPESTPSTITLAATDVDVPAQQLTFAIQTGPSHGTLGGVVLASATTATVVYTPIASYTGVDSFTFTAGDGTASSAATTVTISLTSFTVCGDGVVETPETCDDYGLASGDGCSATCQTEDGWSCDGAPSACDAICNDGKVIAGEEECDDGNDSDTDGCTTQCHTGVICAATNASLAAGDHFATDPKTGTCYVAFDDEVTTFDVAKTLCTVVGGHLATIKSFTEQTRVASVQNPEQNPWIGGTDTAVEGTFAWVTGETFGFTSFEPGQPDGGSGIVDEDCLHLLSSAAPSGMTGGWDDAACDDAGVVGRICEVEAP